jgi:hypothetical protein
MRRDHLITIVVSSFAFAALFAAGFWYWTANRITLTNNANTPLRDIILVVDSSETSEVALRRKIRKLEPGDSASFFFHERNPVARVRFELDGQAFDREELFDLWSGESWILSIDSQGGLASKYDIVD